jgi:tetratricopeptide (TPR) repeat protein
LHLKKSQLPEAISLFTQALQHEDTPTVRFNLGFTHYLHDDFPKAWEHLSTIEEEEYIPSTRLLMARMMYEEGAVEESISLLEEHVPNYANNAEIVGFLSLMYFDMNNEDAAKELSQQALELDPTNYDAQLVDIMLRLITQETSVEEIQNLLHSNPKDSRLLFALGSTYMAQGEFALATEQFKKTLEVQPDFYDCHIALGWTQLLNDELPEAHETYQNAISMVDDRADGWAGLAVIYALNANLEQAEQLITKAKALDEDCFLTQIAEVIYNTHKNPQQSQQNLLGILTNANLPAGDKLARVIEELT